MNKQIFNNPHNLLGKFAQLNRAKQYTILLVFACLPACFLLIEYLQVQQQNKHIDHQIQQLEQDLVHQKQILSSLQQSTQNGVTPELTSHIARINQHLQPQHFQLEIKSSQWHFYQEPYFNLHLIGNFTNLRQFLTALLKQEPKLKMLQLHIYKMSDSTLSTYKLNTECRFKLSLHKEEQ